MKAPWGSLLDAVAVRASAWFIGESNPGLSLIITRVQSHALLTYVRTMMEQVEFPTHHSLTDRTVAVLSPPQNTDLSARQCWDSSWSWAFGTSGHQLL